MTQRAAPTFLREPSGGTLLPAKLQPRTSKNEIGEPLGDELKIKVTTLSADLAADNVRHTSRRG